MLLFPESDDVNTRNMRATKPTALDTVWITLNLLRPSGGACLRA